MKWVITEPSGVRAALKNPKKEPKPRLSRFIKKKGPLNVTRRLDVYAEAYFARLVECLESDFGLVAKVVGENRFRGIVANYLFKHPSRSYTVGDVGRHLPRFLKTYFLNEEYPYLADLAQLEWCVLRAFHSEDTRPIDFDEIKKIRQDQWATAVLELDPSVYLISTIWTIDEIWNTPQKRSLNKKSFQKSSKRYLLISRYQHRAEVQNITKQQFDVLKMMQKKFRLDKICDVLESRLTKDAQLPPLMQWFQLWMEREVIGKVGIAHACNVEKE